MESSGWLYCLSNSSMPGLLKIGQTKNEPKARAEQLQTTGVPLPFKIEFAKYVKDYVKKEKILISLLEQYSNRINPKREFFRVDPERVVSALRMIMIQDVTPKIDIVEDETDQISLDRERTMRGRFNFEMVQIQPNSELSFYRDPTIKAIVIDSHKVEFEGETHSTSSSALKIFHRMGYEWTTIQGPKYWVFEGETLTERRSRMENE